MTGYPETAIKKPLEGERKQVTVLFADLKDSTELIRGLDPEEAQRLLGDIHAHRQPQAQAALAQVG